MNSRAQDHPVIRWRDTGLGFSPLTLILHWITFLLVVLWLLTDLLASQATNAASAAGYLEWHRSFAGVICLLALWRLRRRLTQHHPLPLGGVNPAQVIASRTIALAMLLALLGLPLLEWVVASTNGQAMTLAGSFTLPAVVPESEMLARFAGWAEQIILALFLFSLGLHFLGALKHHCTLKDDSLRRMLGKKVEL